MKKLLLIIVYSLVVCVLASAQTVVYSKPDKDDIFTLNFSIIGKFYDKYLVYKKGDNTHYLCSYDNDMKLVRKARLDFMPANVGKTDIVTYNTHFYIFYEYMTDNIVYCKVAKLDGNTGQIMGEPIEIAATTLSRERTKVSYTILCSDNKQKIMVVSSMVESNRTLSISGILLDQHLQHLHKALLPVPPLGAREEHLTEFDLDNDGTLVFLRTVGNLHSRFTDALYLCVKPALVDSIYNMPIDLKQLLMNQVRLKVDNIHNRYLITAFYRRSQEETVEGLYSCVWDKATRLATTAINTTLLNYNLRNSEGKGKMPNRAVFDDFLIQSIIAREDGGYIITSECMTPPLIKNIAVFSIDASGKREWTNIIKKTQLSSTRSGYAVMNQKDAIHFVFNPQKNRTFLLSNYSINGEGELHKNRTPKKLKSGYVFSTRAAKQVSSWQMIVPCSYKEHVCFAKLEF